MKKNLIHLIGEYGIIEKSVNAKNCKSALNKITKKDKSIAVWVGCPETGEEAELIDGIWDFPQTNVHKLNC